MGNTNRAYGQGVLGIPVISGQAHSAYGRYWFVDGNQGSDGNNGKTTSRPFLTMAKAFAQIDSGDVIIFRGNVREQLVSPVGVFDVTILGMGFNRPRNADAHTGNKGYSSSTWRAPAVPVVGQASLRVLQQGWRFENFLMNMEGATAAGFEIVRDAGAGDAERDASHAAIVNCRIAGTGIGIRITAAGFTENPFNVLIKGNTFNSCTTAILAASAQPNMAQILDNYFPSNTSCITAKLQASIIKGNTIGVFTAAGNSGGIDVRSGGANNLITGNWLGGAYSKAGGYNTEANDSWWGNFADVAGGVTQSDPA